MKIKSSFISIILISTSLSAIKGCKNINANSLSSIPPERISINRTYDQSGLAKRVAKALEEDKVLFALRDKSNIYVSQKGSKIILKGTASDKYIIERIVNIASGVKGISKIDASQIKVVVE